MAFRASKLMAPLALVVACHGSNNTTPRDAAENARDALLPEPDIGVARDAAEDARGALLPQAEAGSESTHTDAAADGRDQEEGSPPIQGDAQADVAMDSTAQPDASIPPLDGTGEGNAARLDSIQQDGTLLDSAEDGGLPARDAPQGKPEIGWDLGKSGLDAGAESGPLSIAPGTSPVDLGQVDKGKTGTPTYLTVTNVADRAVGPLVVSTSDPQLVLVDDQCTGKTLTKSASCQVGVLLKPTQTGVISGTVTVTDGAATSASIPVAGIGLPYYLLASSPPSYDFGAWWIGTVPPPQTFTVVNAGALSSGRLAVTLNESHFALSNDTCDGTSLEPGAACTLDVSYNLIDCHVMYVRGQLTITPKVGTPLGVGLGASCDY